MVYRLSRIAAASALIALGAARADPLLATDASWLVTPTAPGAGWNTSAAFNTSSWQNASVLYNVSDYLGPGYVAQALWSSGGQFSPTETTLWARRVWNLAALPISAALVAGFDDDADLWINGVQVVSDHNGVANNVGPVDLLPYLSLGDNLIAFTASDNWPVYGYNHAAWVQIDGQPGGAVPEPQTAALMFAGLMATAASVRRRKTKLPPLR
jgi:hypothetical protein